MSLLRTLEIERKFLEREDELGLSFAERMWEEEGRPVEPANLCRVIEAILTACQREGVRYPAILLRRKKELQRGTWQPPRVGPYGSQAGAPASDGVCQLCGGTGSITNPGGLSARYCECYLRKTQASYEAKRRSERRIGS